MNLDAYVHDESVVRFEDAQILSGQENSEPKTLVDYLHGRCHLFALVACRVLGDNAKFSVLFDYEGYEGEGQLLHAYVDYNDIMFDARGQIELEDLASYEADSSFNVGYFEMSEDEVLEKLSIKHWGEPLPDEMESLSAFFNKYKKIYIDGGESNLLKAVEKMENSNDNSEFRQSCFS